MALLDAQAGQVLIDAPPSPRLPRIMSRLRACRDGELWRAQGHMALDVADALQHARPSRTEAFEDLAYRLFFGGEPDDVQACLALRRGLEPPREMPPLRKPLYPYQEQGVAFLDRAGSGILADEPGLGKTLQGIAFALLSPGPCLIVCPATAKHVWEREIEDCVQADAPAAPPGPLALAAPPGPLAPADAPAAPPGPLAPADAPAASSGPLVQVLSGTSPAALAGARFTIVNYDVLPFHLDVLRDAGFGCLVADEVHRCKNIRAQRTRALMDVARGIPRKALLSGTLMMNGADDLFPPLAIVRPSAFPDHQAFMERYTQKRAIKARVRGRWRTKTIRTGSRNLHELHRRMEPFTIRRTLAEVKDQLPELRHTVVRIDLPDDLQAAYRSAVAPLGRGARKLLDAPGRLRAAQAATDVCIEAKARILPELLLDRVQLGRKTLVFSTRLGLLDEVQGDPKLGASAVRIDGRVPTAARRAIEESFQKDSTLRLFLGQTRACSEALTLDAADTVVIAEADWSPQANEQAIRRALRINTRHPVEVVWLVVRGTLDEARLEVLRRKREEFATVMQGTDEAAVLEATLAALPDLGAEFP